MTKRSFLAGVWGLLWAFGASIDAQPLAQYTFNDDTANDVSPNGLHGVLLGNAAIVTDAERGQVLQVNQSGMRADGPFAITTSFTLSAWIKLELPRTGRFYFGGPWQFRTDNEGSPEHYWIEVRYPLGNFLNKADTRTAANPQGQLDGKWHHLVLILPEDGFFKVYFDGVPAPFRDADPVRVHDFGGSIGPLFFGTQNDAGGDAIAGYMDDIRVYDYAVGEAEIPDLMTEGSGSRQAHDPEPKNRATGVEIADAVLRWKTGLDPNDPNVPNPAITGHNLWLSIPYDPLNPPAAPDWEDPGVLIVPLGSDVDPADGNVDPNASYSPTLKKDSLYYWIVDESLGAAHVKDWDNIIIGNVWTFETETSGPEVEAGDSIVTWLKAGTTTVELNGTVEDSTGDVSVIQWSVLTSPFGATAYIANPAAAATTATLTEPGAYVLQLYAKDATLKEDDDALEIKVYANSCEAAYNSPKGYTAPEFDFNNNCIEDFVDLDLFCEKWLEDASLTDEVRFDAGPISVPFVEFTNPVNGSLVVGEIVINAVAYDPAVGTNDGDGMEGDGIVRFQVLDSTGAVVGTQNENLQPFDMTWNTAEIDPGTSLPVYPNGSYTIRVTAESDAGYALIKEISVTVNNP